MSSELLSNFILSSNPCPKCVEASMQAPMTLEDWAASKWGLPGSSGRYCEDDCHCLLAPSTVIEAFSALSEFIRLRNEPGSKLLAIVDIGPKEKKLKEAMEEWEEQYGPLPPEIYRMKLEDIEPYLRRLMVSLETDEEK